KPGAKPCRMVSRVSASSCLATRYATSATKTLFGRTWDLVGCRLDDFHLRGSCHSVTFNWSMSRISCRARNDRSGCSLMLRRSPAGLTIWGGSSEDLGGAHKYVNNATV